MRSELYLNGTLVDLKEEVQCALTLQIADIREPKSRNGSFSKTIKLPGTKTINKLLGGIFDVAEDVQTSGVVNFTPDFNANLKCEAILYADGLEQFRGNMRLLSIERDQHDFSLLYYNVVLFGEVANIFVSIADAKLSDLDFSDLNHTYNKATQKATWTNTNYGSGYVYPMINYGGIPLGTWDVNDFYPAIYTKEYVDRIFSAAGFTYTSAFFDSATFKRRIMPFAGEKMTITAAQQQQRLFAAYTSTLTSGVAVAVDPVIYDTETLDPSSQFDPATGIFTTANSGYYSFYSSGVVTYDAIGTVVGGGLAYINIILKIGTSQYSIAQDTISSFATYTSGQTIHTTTYRGWSQEIFMSAGQTANMRIAASFTGWTGTIGQTISANSYFLNRVTNTQIVDGNTLDMSAALPVDIKQADFLSTVMRKYNLYCEPDKTNPKNLIIDTYDDFYGTGITRDWTKKVNSTKQMLVTPMGALDARRYKLKYSDDTDYWNKFYKEKWQESYGEKNIDITNDFLKNTNANEILFAPTPSIGDSSNDRIIPEIYSLGNNGVQSHVRSKLRILYWGGALATVNAWTYNSTVSGASTETTYPYAGHVDDPIIPTLDLSFGVPREIYWVNPYGATSYTDNNTYNIYHSKFISEITDVNSKLVTLFVYLKPLDINQLSFRDKIFIDGHYFRLQKVLDYNPISEGDTKVELLKIKQGVPFVHTLKPLTFTYLEVIGKDRAPTSGGNVGQGDSSFQQLNTVTGADNYVSRTSSGVTVSGSSNRIGNNCNSISVLNSSGVVIMDNLTNVSVINTNDVVVSGNNVSYVNGIRMRGSSDIHTASTSQTITALGIWECTGGMTLTLDVSLFETGDLIIIKYKTGGGVVTISAGGSNKIDDNTTAFLPGLYDSKQIYYNGTDFYTLAK